jgi:hypothetical protein
MRVEAVLTGWLHRYEVFAGNDDAKSVAYVGE